MMKQPEQHYIQKLILTTKSSHAPPISSQSSPQLSSSIYVLGHECLHPTVSKVQSKPITLQTLCFHRENLNTMENTSVTGGMIQSQLLWALENSVNKNNQTIKSQQSKLGKQVYVVSSTGTNGSQKSPQSLKKYHIIRSYQYTLPAAYSISNLSSLQKIPKQSQILASPQHIAKELQYTFGIKGDNQQQVGFIGEIDLPYHYQLAGRPTNTNQANQIYRHTIRDTIDIYFNFSLKTNCPIFVNLLKFGYDAVDSDIGNKYANQVTLQDIAEYFVTEFGSKLRQENSVMPVYKNIVLVNPIIKIQHYLPPYLKIGQSQSVGSEGYHGQVSFPTLPIIHRLYQLGFTLCFDLCRYQHDVVLRQLAMLVLQYPNQTIISAGLKYKTDFRQFAGKGLGVIDSFKALLINVFKSNTRTIDLVFNQNIINKMAWFEKKVVVVKVKMWKCANCGKELPETQEAFKKFGISFCQIDCVRSYKF